MYYLDDNFYHQLEDIVDDLDLEVMSDTDTIKVENCALEPIITLSAEILADYLEGYLEERHSENNQDEELDKIIQVFKNNIDFEKINSELPKLYYPNNTFVTLTKQELITLL